MKHIPIFIISMLALTTLSCAAQYNADQQAAMTGYGLSFHLGQQYQAIADGKGNITAYNSLVNEWNAFVQQNYGAESGLLMQTMANTDINLQKPYVSAVNTTNNGIVHSVDGSNKYPPTYTTNDINAMSDSARQAYQRQDSPYNTDNTLKLGPDGKPLAGTGMGDGYLGGV